MLKQLLGIVLCTASSFFAFPCAAQDPLAGLRAEHPRLIADRQSWQRLNERRKTDPELNALLSKVESDARHILDEKLLEHRKIGRRLLDVSRASLQRVMTLSSAYRITGDKAFLNRAETEMLTVAAFPDWNPSHFLDVAEMTAGLAYGYDWLYAELSPESQAKIRTAILDKGLRPALDTGAAFNSWQHTDNNWNQVCFGGLVLGALAVAESDRDTAGKILSLARANVTRGLKAYAPDGVFPEGPAYWSYGTSYSVMMIAALESATGDSWKVAESPGFPASAGGFLQANGPTGLFFNYSDCTEKGSVEPILFWFARRLNDPGLVRSSRAELSRTLAPGTTKHLSGESARFFPLLALWWPDQASDKTPSLPLRWNGRGPNPIGIFRSSWTDTNALYLAFKGGAGNLSHAHLDAGSFVFELDGVRWAHDLGSQEYESLESKGVDLWNRKQDSQRWTVFRLNNRSHNTLTINDQIQRVNGEARITEFSDSPEDSKALVDLSAVYAGQATHVLRGFRVLHNNEVLIQDELSGLKAKDDVQWTFVTGSEVTLSADGKHAVLRENGQTLQIDLATPATATFLTRDASPPPNRYDALNPGRRMLVVHAVPKSGTVTIAVRLHRPTDANNPARQTIEPLAHWFPSNAH